MWPVGWFLVCTAIALLGLVYLVLTAREVWRKASRLLEEVDQAVRRAEAASRPGQDPVAPEAT